MNRLKDYPILIVDDYDTMLRILRGMLNSLGFDNIYESRNGYDAFEKIKETKFKLIISDWNMAGMDGLTLLKNVRAYEKSKDVPFLMITAENKSDNVLAAKSAGANNYILKPFNVNTLKQKLTAIFGLF